jgi:tight adherence protein B
LLTAIVVFAAVAGFVGVLAYMFLRETDGSRAAQRLDHLVNRGGRKDSASDLLLKQALSEIDKKTILDSLTPEIFHLHKVFEQADAAIRPSALFGIALVMAVVGGAVSWLSVGTIYVAPVGATLMFTGPFLWLFFKRARRMKAFAGQLPDALELVARALRAGHSLAAGMHVVAEEMPAPVSKEFSRVYEEQNLGIPLEEAMKSMCERVPNLDLRFFVTAVAIQRQTGGDLAEILDKIGYVVRERYKILGQVKALTAEGRLSGVVLIGLPFGLFLMMLHIKPDYVELLWKDPLGIKMAVFGLIMQILGALVIKKIVDIKV